jgi:hypothetical protein
MLIAAAVRKQSTKDPAQEANGSAHSPQVIIGKFEVTGYRVVASRGLSDCDTSTENSPVS